MLDLVQELVEMESPSLEKAAVDALGVRLAELAVDSGAQVETVEQSEYGNHLRLDFGGPPTCRVVLVGHMDTVWSVGTLNDSPFRVTDDQAFGPGVFDMKAGLVQMLYTMQMLRERMPCHVQAVVTSDEEIGSPSSRSLIEATCRGAAAALVLEPPLPPDGRVKTSRKGVGILSLHIEGREAHAGLEPEKGVHAILELSHQVQRLQQLNEPERGVSVSVGRVSGGTRTNVIPAEAVAHIDVRARTQSDADELESRIRSFEPVLDGARLRWRGGMNRPPMERTESVAELYGFAKSVAAELGFRLGEGPAGGGSDGNFTAALGVPTLDGLGVNGAGAHAVHEHIVVSDLPRRTALLAGLVERIASAHQTSDA